MSEKYPVGSILTMNNFWGIIIENLKLPNDICVAWETGQILSYDEEYIQNFFDESIIQKKEFDFDGFWRAVVVGLSEHYSDIEKFKPLFLESYELSKLTGATVALPGMIRLLFF